MAAAGAIVSTTLLEGDKETKEYEGRKHIGAADLLREMDRRRTANPAWNKEAAIGHRIRSFSNDVAVWWEEAIPSDNSPKRLKVLTKNWEEFKFVFRQAWIIKAVSLRFIRQNDPKESEDEESEDDWSPEESEDEESEDDWSPKESEDEEAADEWGVACRPEDCTQWVKAKYELTDLLPQCYIEWWLSD
jgi:hypothetical protein